MTIDRGERRLSTASGHATSTRSEVASSAERERRDDVDGDANSPENSEPHWTYTLVLSWLDGASGSCADGGNASGPVVYVVTSSPTPYYPMVVTLLRVKVHFLLLDDDVDGP